MRSFKQYLNEQLSQLTEISLPPNHPSTLYEDAKRQLHQALSSVFPAIHQAASSVPLSLEMHSGDTWPDGLPKEIRHYKYKSGLDALHMVASTSFHFRNHFMPKLRDSVKSAGQGAQNRVQTIEDEHHEAFDDILSNLHSQLLHHARRIDPNVTEHDVGKYMLGVHHAYAFGLHPLLHVHHSQVSEHHHGASSFHYMRTGVVPHMGPHHALLTTPEHMTAGHPLEDASQRYGLNPNSPGGGVYSHEET